MLIKRRGVPFLSAFNSRYLGLSFEACLQTTAIIYLIITFNSRYLGLSFEAKMASAPVQLHFCLSIPVTWDYPLKLNLASRVMPSQFTALSIPVTWDYPLKRVG